MMTVPNLPGEIIEQIIAFLPVGLDRNDNVGALTLARCLSVCKLFKDIAMQADLWRPHYEGRWRRGKQHPFRESTSIDYRIKYRERMEDDAKVAECFERIVNLPKDRCLAAAELAPYAEDAEDYMIAQAETNVNEIGSDSDVLSRRYWAKEILGHLNRRKAMSLWKSASLVSFEDLLISFALFRGGDSNDIKVKLDGMADECRSLLSPLSGDTSVDPRKVVVTVLNYMTQKGFGPADPAEFHALDGAFPNFVLSTHRKTLPMSLVWVFSSICRRVGLDVRPINWPRTIQCICIQLDSTFLPLDRPGSSPAPFPEGPFYVDVFRGGMIATRTELENQVDLPPEFHHVYLEPASPSSIIKRVCINITTSINALPVLGYPFRQSIDSFFAVIAAESTLGGNRNIPDDLSPFHQCHPLDVSLLMRIAEQTRSGDHQRRIDILRSIMAKDCATPVPKVRREIDGGFVPKYSVGQVFQHAKFDYKAVINGWTATCEADKEWQVAQNVANLLRGSQQAWYNVIDVQGMKRYVAEENVQPLSKVSMEEIQGLLNLHDIGSYFSNVQFSRARFVLGATLQATYPEEDR